MIGTALLVPGSWHGAWCYDAVVERLPDLRVVAIDLPSNDGASGLADDAAAVRAALDRMGEPAVVVGHSYGGIAISEGAAGSTHAAALVYLCAFMLEPGQALLDAMDHQLPPWIALDEAAGSHLAQDTERSLHGDCPADVAAAAAARLTSQSVAAIATPQTVAAWQSLPSTYVICTDDQAVPPPARAAMAARAATAWSGCRPRTRRSCPALMTWRRSCVARSDRVSVSSRRRPQARRRSLACARRPAGRAARRERPRKRSRPSRG